MKAKLKKPAKIDRNYVEPNMQMDVDKRNANIDDGRELCSKCSGTGNEFYSMWKECSKCNWKGYLEKKQKITR